MASIPPSDDQNQRKPALIRQRPLMLKDYLRDDFLSSCSSNGFKSFPRRQCCTSVRILLEVDLKARMKQRLLSRNRSNAAASTTIFALQRASEAVIKAVKKQLPFHSGKSQSPPKRNGGSRKGLLPRSLSRKLFFKRSFCSKASHKEESENGRWRLFRDILNEQDRPSDQGAHHFSTMIAAGGVSTSTTSISWAESEFSSEILRSSSSKSETSSENDVVEDKSDLPVRKVNNRVDETVGEDSCLGATTATHYGANAKEWPNEEGKEQFSPVSVLDCPFEDDEEASSSFQRNLALMEGCRKQKLMHKNRRLSETLKLEPVDLEKRIALSELNHEAPQSAIQPACSTSPQENIAFDNKEENPADPRKGSRITWPHQEQ
ncbi:hypothetical protein CJ030_MR4G021149 [Morella rubra]|uniref:Uncharacterized protein n=1 Tax=Morella rubra TaxID=262757 RepID=A0A6A1VW29_9ROSI|nr:hypothetical protein CJ030_MR4G021149 [Morella rubra]